VHTVEVFSPGWRGPIAPRSCCGANLGMHRRQDAGLPTGVNPLPGYIDHLALVGLFVSVWTVRARRWPVHRDRAHPVVWDRHPFLGGRRVYLTSTTTCRAGTGFGHRPAGVVDDAAAGVLAAGAVTALVARVAPRRPRRDRRGRHRAAHRVAAAGRRRPAHARPARRPETPPAPGRADPTRGTAHGGGTRAGAAQFVRGGRGGDALSTGRFQPVVNGCSSSPSHAGNGSAGSPTPSRTPPA
jgi:hypothetical protein